MPCRLRPAAHRLDGLAVLEGLGEAAHHLGRPDPGPLLRQDDEVGAGRRRAGDEPLRALDVLRLRVGGVQLDAGHAKPVGHALRIAWEGDAHSRRRSSPRRGRSPSSAPRRSRKAEQRRHALPARPGLPTSSRCARTARRSSGIPCVDSVAEIEEPVDLVDVFRRAEFCPEGGRAGRGSGREGALAPARHRLPRGAAIAEEAGLDYVENACTKIVHAAQPAA